VSTLKASPLVEPSADPLSAHLLTDDAVATGPGPGSGLAWTGRVVATGALLLLLVGCWSNNPSLVLLSLVGTASALLARRVAWDIAVTAGALLVLAVAVGAGTLAGWLGVDLLAAPWVVAAVYLAATLAVTVLSWVRPTRQSHGSASRWRTCAFLPAGVATATALLQGASITTVQSWAFYGTDLTNHAGILAQVQRQGSLEYQLSAYPRGLHMMSALASVPRAPLASPGELLGYDLRLTAAVAWLALALLICAGTTLTIRLGLRMGLARSTYLTAAGLLGVLALLTNTFLESFVDQAAAPSLTAVAVLYAFVLAAAVFPRRLSDPRLLVAASAVTAMLLAQLWQALAVVPLVTLVVLALPATRHALTKLTSRPRASSIGWAVVAAAAGLVAALPVIHVLQAGGLHLAGQQGDLAGQPWRILVPAGLSALGLLAWRRQLWARVMMGSALGLAAVVAVLLQGAGAGLDLTQWYPLKACWFLTLFLAPWLALTTARLLRLVVRPVWARLGRLGRLAFVVRVSLVASLAAVALVTWLPWQLGPTPDLEGAWQQYHSAAASGNTRPLFLGGAYDLALDYGTSYQPAVVVPYRLERNFFFDPYSSLIVSKLLGFQSGSPDVAGADNVCGAVRLAAGHRAAVVLSRAPASTVRADMAKHGCAGRARIVTLRRNY
jgi:hypothetical protein